MCFIVKYNRLNIIKIAFSVDIRFPGGKIYEKSIIITIIACDGAYCFTLRQNSEAYLINKYSAFSR